MVNFIINHFFYLLYFTLTNGHNFIALFTIIRTDRNMLLACYSHKHISYRIRTIIRKAID
ncbi:hypothetical protein [Wolbachia endosymbiont (group A) of Aleiodes leptofemur]|uniref:hypothetical protein n=1 Tax=Wolbachia endosymbiont (group A) of Aleiodes leptofemur TaxID=3077919 RepID=UPI00333E34CE